MKRHLIFLGIPSACLLLPTFGFWYLSEFDNAGAWDALGWFVMALGTGALWLLYAFGYVLVVAFLNGYKKSVATVLGLLCLTGIGWLTYVIMEENICRHDASFYVTLTGKAPAKRTQYIQENGDVVKRDDPCGSEALSAYFVRNAISDPPESQAQLNIRLATWSALTEAGLPVQNYLYSAILDNDGALMEHLVTLLKDEFIVRRFGKDWPMTKPMFLNELAYAAVKEVNVQYDEAGRKRARRVLNALLNAGAPLDLKARKRKKTLREVLEKSNLLPN